MWYRLQLTMSRLTGNQFRYQVMVTYKNQARIALFSKIVTVGVLAQHEIGNHRALKKAIVTAKEIHRLGGRCNGQLVVERLAYLGWW